MTPPNATPDFTQRALIEWKEGKPGSSCYLGSANDGLEMKLCFDTESELLLWFTLPVKFNSHSLSGYPRQKTLRLYSSQMFNYEPLEPCFSVRSPTTFQSSESTNLALKQARLGPNHLISRLRFRLRSCGEVFIPKAKKSPLIPASERALDMLAALKSLSQAKDFHVYILTRDQHLLSMSTQKIPYQLLMDLCQKVSAGKMKNNAIDFTICDDYKEGMVCNGWENIDLHRAIGMSEIVKKASCFASTLDSSTTANLDTRSAAQQQQGNLVGRGQTSNLSPPQYNEAVLSGARLEIGKAETTQVGNVESEYDHTDPQCDSRLPHPEIRCDTLEREVHKTPNLIHPTHKFNSTEERKRKATNATRDDPQCGSMDKTRSSSINPSKRVRFVKPMKLAGFRDDIVDLMIWLDNFGSDLVAEYDSLLREPGEAARMGDANLFRVSKFTCMADVSCNYESLP